MLLVGLADGPDSPAVARRMTGLGAVRGQAGAPPAWNIGEPAIVVLAARAGRGGQWWPGLHLVLGETGADRVDAEVTRTGVDGLWADRLVPFEANLREGRRAPRRIQAVLADPDPTWAGQAGRLIGRLGYGVGDQVIRIDHIGSTSVPSLPAKQLLDIQVVVPDLDVAARVAGLARRAGFVHVPGQ